MAAITTTTRKTSINLLKHQKLAKLAIVGAAFAFLFVHTVDGTGSSYYGRYSYEKAGFRRHGRIRIQPASTAARGERTATFIFDPVIPARYHRGLPTERQLKISLTVTFDRENYQKWCDEYPIVCEHQRYEMAMSDLKFPLCPYGREEQKTIYGGERRALDEWNSLFSPRPCDQIGHDIYELLEGNDSRPQILPSSSSSFASSIILDDGPVAGSQLSPMMMRMTNGPAAGSQLSPMMMRLTNGPVAGSQLSPMMMRLTNGPAAGSRLSPMMNSKAYVGGDEWYRNFMQHYQNLWANKGRRWSRDGLNNHRNHPLAWNNLASRKQ